MIYDTDVISSSDRRAFNEILGESLEKYQAAGLTVEVQYCPTRMGNHSVTHNALVIVHKGESG